MTYSPELRDELKSRLQRLCDEKLLLGNPRRLRQLELRAVSYESETRSLDGRALRWPTPLISLWKLSPAIHFGYSLRQFNADFTSGCKLQKINQIRRGDHYFTFCRVSVRTVPSDAMNLDVDLPSDRRSTSSTPTCDSPSALRARSKPDIRCF